jgi:hypothetical protein
MPPLAFVKTGHEGAVRFLVDPIPLVLQEPIDAIGVPMVGAGNDPPVECPVEAVVHFGFIQNFVGPVNVVIDLVEVFLPRILPKQIANVVLGLVTIDQVGAELWGKYISWMLMM